MSNYIKYVVVGDRDGNVVYTLSETIMYYSERYDNFITVTEGFISDGASGAVDIKGSRSWWVHDSICEDPQFDDSTPITAWMAARVLSDILAAESKMINGKRTITRALRSKSWLWATFLFGCKKARENGWVKST